MKLVEKMYLQVITHKKKKGIRELNTEVDLSSTVLRKDVFSHRHFHPKKIC